jgi:hypothetical protein
MQMPRPRRTQARILPVLLPLVALGLSACGDSVEPDDPLAGLDELAIYAAIADRLGVLDHTTEANSNLRQAVGWPTGSLDAGLFGSALVYDPQSGWMVAPDEPGVAPNAVRVTWYRFTGQSVSLPLSQQGRIDLTDQGSAATESRLRVHIVGGTASQLADYTLQIGHTESAAVRTEHLRAQGFVGDGARQLQLTYREDESLSVATGDQTSSHVVNLADAGFTYAASVQADSTAATGVATARFSGSVTVDGVTTRLELDMEEQPGAALSGTGSVTHAGVKIADVAVSGNQLDMVFTRPDGGSFTGAQRSRLGTLVVVLLMPVLSVQEYFS